MAAAVAAQQRAARLEYQAVQLMNQYGWVLPGPAKVFFRELAEFLNWSTLKKAMK